jgi:methylated-DNA-[protein]-cysteine S-methyltransferase
MNEHFLDSPIGTVRYVTTRDGVVGLGFVAARGGARGTDAVAGALRAYFAGDLEALRRVRACAPGTRFFAAVWSALRRIPPGETRSYSGLARELGHPTAARAVARANALNPVALVVPCHRVIGSDGALRGYEHGIERKRWLLEHEREPHAARRRGRATPA